MNERTPEEQRRVDESILRREIKTEGELLEALGELTPEEKAKLADPAMYAPPTPEELAFLGPNFTAEVMKLAEERHPEFKKAE